jgi:hypothetical protein
MNCLQCSTSSERKQPTNNQPSKNVDIVIYLTIAYSSKNKKQINMYKQSSDTMTAELRATEHFADMISTDV